MAAVTREITVRLSTNTQQAINEAFSNVLYAIQFYRGETLDIRFIVYENKQTVDMTGNTFELVFKDPQNINTGTLAFSDNVIDSSLIDEGQIVMRINTNTPEMTAFIGYSINLKSFQYELTAYLGNAQERKIAVTVGRCSSDVNQCIEGPDAIGTQINNHFRIQPSSSKNLLTEGNSLIYSLVTNQIVKPISLDLYVVSASNITVNPFVSCGTDDDDQIILPTQEVTGSFNVGDVISFDLQSMQGIVNQDPFLPPSRISFYVQNSAQGDAFSVLPVLRCGFFQNDETCSPETSSSSSSSSSSGAASVCPTDNCVGCPASYTFTATGFSGVGDCDLDGSGTINGANCFWIGIYIPANFVQVNLECTSNNWTMTMLSGGTVLTSTKPAAGDGTCPPAVFDNFTGGCGTGTVTLS